jgi:hypothetical protein
MIGKPTILRAQPGPQTAVLATAADIAFYGGAAGGGKTWALLMEALRHVGNPGYGGVIFRRTCPQITAQGGLWDEAAKVYPLVGGVPQQSTLTWRFPSGAKIQFRHLQHDEDRLKWQGAQVPFLGFDEVSHFSEKQFWYLLSRNRSVCGVTPYVRATTNPAPGWVKEFLAPWLEHGSAVSGEKEHPQKAASGELRWFVRRNGEIVWVEPEFRDEDGQPPKSVTFVAASVYDNRILLDANPEYLVNLKSLPVVEQERLLRGNWDVFEGAFFSEFSLTRHGEAVEYTPESIPRHWRFGGGLDWGFAKPFAFGLFVADEVGGVHALDEIYEAGLENHEQAARVVAKLLEWKLDPREVVIAADPAMWARKRSSNGGRPKADIEDFQKAGLRVVEANNHRRHGLSQMRSFLHAPGKFAVARSRCPNLVREFQSAVFDERDPEDMDTLQDDHILDATRYYLAGRVRPSGPDPEVPPEPDYAPSWLKQGKRGRGL